MSSAAPPTVAPPRRRRGLAGRADTLAARLVLATVLLALIVAGAVAALVLAISDLRDATIREAAAKDVVADTVTLQKLVLDVEAGLRGFILADDDRFLTPMNAARRRIPGALRTFVERAEDAGNGTPARAVADLVNDYLVSYATPLLEIARDNPAAARGPDAGQEGRQRTDEIRRRLDAFLVAERGRVQATAASANELADRTVAVGIAGIGASIVLIALLGVYLGRSIARPVRDVASAATRVAEGDLGVALPERGPGEIGRLRRAFNAMARDLAQRERELELQNEQLRQSERLKSELVSIVSHEIRTPLASILGFASVLLRRDLDEESRRRYLTIIEEEGKRLAGLLNDFLDVQRIEEDRLELNRRLVDVGAVVRRQVELFAGQSELHRLELALADEPLVVSGDPDRLAQVVANLLSNAIKYSPDGGRIAIRGERTNGSVRVVVEDEGLGIPADDLDRVFTKFARAHASRGIAGSGLGLALARAIVEAHDGRIAVASAVGEGSTFSLELPRSEER